MGAATFLSACGAAWAGASCNQILGLDAYYDCPQDGPCADAGSGGNGGHGGSAPLCATPADCPAGGECATPVCTGGKCGLAAKDDGLACMADAGSGYQCTSGACGCPAANECGAACVDTQTDAMNCGACGAACPAGIACEGGKCACPNAGVVCGDACVDTQTDGMNCGMCGMACTVAGATCESGTCTCPGGGTECSGVCVDTQTDTANCGKCGMACTATGATCESGMCTCPGSKVECSGACTDTASDPKNCGACGRDCLGGTCQAGMCEPVVLASGQSAATAIAVNATDVFWTNYALSGAVMKVPIIGGTSTVLASNQENAGYVAIDSANVYWTTAHVTATTKSGTIRKVPLAGGTPTTIGTCAASVPSGLALDNTTVYWLCFEEGTVNEVQKTGGAQATLTSATTNPAKLAASGTNLFFTESALALTKIATSGGATVSLGTYPGGTGAAGGLVVSGSNAYWTFGATVFTAPLAGGAPTVLSQAAGAPAPIATDGTGVYWSTTQIFKVSIGGTTPSTVSLSAANGLALDTTYLYLAQGATVARLAK